MGKQFPISLRSTIIFTTAAIALFHLICKFRKRTRPETKQTRPKALETDAIIDVLKFLPRDALNSIRLTSSRLNRLIRAYFSTKPFYLVEKISCFVGPLYPGETGKKPMHIAKLAAEVQRREFRARHCVLHIRVALRHDVMDSDFFSQEHRTENSENTESNIKQINQEIKKNLPLIAPIWENAELEIVLDFFRFSDDYFFRYFSAYMGEIVGHGTVNHTALMTYILFGDADGQELGPLLAKCAKVHIREYDGHVFYTPFNKLKALHHCKDLDFAAALVVPRKLAEFLIADTTTEMRFLYVSLYYGYSRDAYTVMQTLLEEDFCQSKKPHSYRCRIRFMRGMHEDDLPKVRRIANETTDEYLSFERIETVPIEWAEFQFEIVRCAREQWATMLS